MSAHRRLWAGIGGWRDRELDDPRHDERSAALLGIALGLAFTVCFLTGLLSHLIQQPPGWFVWFPQPAGLYRVTQSVHVATGIACVPLLLAKLWSVFPRLFQTPLARNTAHALERLSLLPLVGGSLFLLVTGVANIDLWYPFPFFFPAAHFAAAWLTIGALIVHVGAKFAVTRTALSPRSRRVPEPVVAAMSRRRFIGWVGASSAALTVVTVGQTVAPLRRLALLAPRRPDVGVQGLPVNTTARDAGVEHVDPATYALEVVRADATLLRLSLDDLRALPQRSATLPIACVEGWSASARWTGVPLADVVGLAGAPARAQVVVVSLQVHGRYSSSVVNHRQLADLDTLLALDIDGAPLAPDHGFPLRLIGPNRPGVQQTKWVTRLVVR